MTAQNACVGPLKNATSHGSFEALGGRFDLMNVKEPSNKASETVLAHLSIRAVDTGLSQLPVDVEGLFHQDLELDAEQ